MMSVARIGILFFGLVAILLLGTWGWAQLVDAVYRVGPGDFVVAITVYGVVVLVFAIVAGFTFLVLSFRNDDPG
jgi:hypothetical protein